MISLSSFIYGCSSWWYLVCSPATSLPHQLPCWRWCNGGVVLCGEQNMPTSFRSFRSPVTSPYQPADEGLVEKGRLISGVCFLSNLVGFVVLAWYRDDVVIRSATEPEVNPKPFSTSQGAKQNTCSLKMPYLTN
ncbi:BnaCnng04020D [Brassica napus]|uniref:BnaCnng04020D protein n=1 Tax=Brassica napus TaxID=3708 RepID=A0A078FQ37_BRANA|nr:BnaCnng04020D [Brassica napus]